jgi:hypothetical protein
MQAAAALLSTVPVTLHPIIRRHSQAALKIHYVLAITAMAALSYHTWNQRSSCRWYLAGAGILWAVLSMAAGVHAIIMKRWGYAWPAVTLRPFHELLRLEIIVPAHWTVQPGQWVYLWLPRASLWTCFQLPLLYVSLWDDTPKQRTLYILVRPQSATLYDRLYMEESLHDCRHSALLLGPYGQCVDFTAFGTILFIVEDIAIMRVLPFIRMLVLASEQRRAMVRELRIVWQMDDFSNISPSTPSTLSTIDILTVSMPPMLARRLDAGAVGPRPWKIQGTEPQPPAECFICLNEGRFCDLVYITGETAQPTIQMRCAASESNCVRARCKLEKWRNTISISGAGSWPWAVSFCGCLCPSL